MLAHGVFGVFKTKLVSMGLLRNNDQPQAANMPWVHQCACLWFAGQGIDIMS